MIDRHENQFFSKNACTGVIVHLYSYLVPISSLINHPHTLYEDFLHLVDHFQGIQPDKKTLIRIPFCIANDGFYFTNFNKISILYSYSSGSNHPVQSKTPFWHDWCIIGRHG